MVNKSCLIVVLLLQGISLFAETMITTATNGRGCCIYSCYEQELRTDTESSSKLIKKKDLQLVKRH